MRWAECLDTMNDERQPSPLVRCRQPGQWQQVDVPTNHQVRPLGAKAVPKHLARKGSPAAGRPAIKDDSLRYRLLDRLANHPWQGVHPLHQGAGIERLQEIAIEPGDTPETSECVGQEDLNAN